MITGEVGVEAQSLGTGRQGLDRNMHRMFQIREYPRAFCRIEELGVRLAGPGVSVPGRLKGVLIIKGISRGVECDVSVIPARGGFLIRGRLPISLKAFDLRPPTILGIIRVQDRVTVSFDVTLVPGPG